MKKSVVTLIILALLATISVGANAAKKDPAVKFAEHKQKILDRITTRQNCVTSAQNIEQLTVCAPKRGAKMAKHAPEQFPERKQKLLDNIEQHRTCVTSARNKDELKACRPEKNEQAEPAIAPITN